MASQVTAGYNPEISLLQGGTAPIVPVQGGGSMEAGSSLPPGYNPDISLLNTGQNAPIFAVRGGANGDTDTAPYESFVIEQYLPSLKSITIPTAPTKAEKQGAMMRYDATMKTKLKLLESFTVNPKPYQSEGDDNPTYKRICPTRLGGRKLPVNFFKKVRRRIVLIENESPTIWLFHNLEGDLSKFFQYMELVPKSKEGVINPNNYVIFTGAFFSPITSSPTNGQLYYAFLQHKQKNMDTFFYITSLTDDFVLTACNLLNDAYSVSTLTSDTKDRPVYPFFEPDIVVFQKQHILLTNGPLPVKDIPGKSQEDSIKLSTILRRDDPSGLYKDVVLIPTVGVEEDVVSGHDTNAPSAKKYFKIDLEQRKKIEFKDEKSIVKCPADESCQGFKGGFKLNELKDDKNLPAAGFYLLRTNPGGTSYFASTKAPGVTVTETKAPGVTVTETKAPGITETKPPAVTETKTETKPPAVTTETTGAVPEVPTIPLVKPIKDEPFQADPTAVKAEEVTIEINSREYRIRSPHAKNVKEDWHKAAFTQSEVDFLNALQLNPTLLAETFGKGYWKKHLADFLRTAIASDCYNDTILLTTIECSNAQQFIKQVYMQMFNRTLEQIYDEMGVPKPKMLSELIDEVSKLKQLGPTGGILAISKFDFTGDLLERFHKIYFDAQKGEYYYDYAELTDATREFLKKMKFHRVEDMNVDEITKKILERMGLSLPKGGPVNPPPGSAQPPPPPPPPPSDPTEYTLDEVLQFEPALADGVFTTIGVKGDGLCFYRAVLKSLLPNPIPDTDASYIPSTEETMAFVREIKTTLETNKDTISVTAFNTTKKVEEHFNEIYALKTGEVEKLEPSVDRQFTEVEKEGRIPIQGDLYKMTFQQYLDRMVDADPTRRPYAEVFDAAIGDVAANLKDVVIVSFQKLPPGSPTRYAVSGSHCNPKYKTGKIPLSKFVFLEYEGGNHYNVLKLAPGKTIPHSLAPAIGGGEEEVLDMGEVVEEKPKNYRKKTFRLKGGKKRTTRKQSRRHM